MLACNVVGRAPVDSFDSSRVTVADDVSTAEFAEYDEAAVIASDSCEGEGFAGTTLSVTLAYSVVFDTLVYPEVFE